MASTSEETIRVCKHCAGEVHEVHNGDEGFSVCEDCRVIEGGDDEMTLAEYENYLNENKDLEDSDK